MRRRAMFILIFIVATAVLFSNAALAVSISIDGYTASGSSSITQSSQNAAIVGSGTTYYPMISNVSVSTTMRYNIYMFNVATNSYDIYPGTEHASNSSGSGGVTVAICYSGTGSNLKYCVPIVETSTHVVSYNGSTHTFQSNSD